MTHETKGAKSAIIEAFNRLVLTRRALKPPVAAVLDEAGVARSTFYDHFNSRDSLLLEALRAPLSVIADAASGAGDEARLSAMLEHFRENRRGAVDMLAGSLAPRLVRVLADLIAERLDADGAKKAIHLADMQIGFIRLWLTGETPYASRDLARLMIESAAAQRAALRAAPEK